MKIKEIINNLIQTNIEYFNSLLDDRKKNMELGKYDTRKLYNIVHKESSPCFFLSTGRCGTALVTKLLNSSKKLTAYHNPRPELIYYSKRAYYENINNTNKLRDLELIVDSARYQYIRDNFLLKRKFVETNNRITFFADQIANLYKRAQFIHLIRHPIDFIKSGLFRGWYSGNHLHDEGRIVSQNTKQWNKFNFEEKIAWLWEATNDFILNFKDKFSDKKIISIKSENLFTKVETSIKICDFLDIPRINTSKINQIIEKPINTGIKKKTNLDIDFTDTQWVILRKIMEKFNYRY